jgi:hypothetical protein
MNFRDPLGALREPATIRARCAAVTRAVADGRSGYFKLDRSRLPELAHRVAALARERLADLKVPHHGQWSRFAAGGIDRKGELDALLAQRSPAERLRAHIDLTVVSVLLGAGAGTVWRYAERPELDALALPVHRQKGEDLLAMLGAAAGKAPAANAEANAETEKPATTEEVGATDLVTSDPPNTALHTTEPPATEAPTTEAPTGDPQLKLRQPTTLGGPEGLAVATFRAFVAGVFSSDPADPLRVDALALKRMDTAALRAVFHSSPSNPLPGLEARAAVLTRLGEVLQEQAERHGGSARPARLIDRFTGAGEGHTVTAVELLRELLTTCAPIWASGSRVLGLPAGDVWPHLWAGADIGVTDELADPGAARPQARSDRATSGWVPLHLLGQWLTWSLAEPLAWAGIEVTGLDALTAVPEQQGLGGLLLDAGVIVPRHSSDLIKTYRPSSDFVVEWRALTVTLMDELAVLVRQALDQSLPPGLPPRGLEGGAWVAGLLGVLELGAGAGAGTAPPLKIDSDGTLF